MDDVDLQTAIHEIAVRQAGLIARWQLRELGLSGKRLDRVWATLGFPTDQPGVRRLPGTPDGAELRDWTALLATMSDAQRTLPPGTERTWRAVHELACTYIGLTAFSAAEAYELVPNAPTTRQILTPHDVQRRLSGVRTVRTRVMPATMELVRGRPVVPVIRAIWDAAWVARREPGVVGRIRRLFERADGRRLLQAEHVHEIAVNPRQHGLPGVVPDAFRAAAISLAEGHSHSGTEAKGRRIVTEIAESLGLAVEPRPFEVFDDAGRAGEADIAIPRIRLDIEIDGPHHRNDPAQRRADRIRDTRMRAISWTVRRYPVELIDEDEVAFRRAVEADMRQAAAAAGVQLTAA